MIAFVKEGKRKYEIVYVDPDPNNPGKLIERKSKVIWNIEDLEFLPYLPGMKNEQKTTR